MSDDDILDRILQGNPMTTDELINKANVALDLKKLNENSDLIRIDFSYEISEKGSEKKNDE